MIEPPRHPRIKPFLTVAFASVMAFYAQAQNYPKPVSSTSPPVVYNGLKTAQFSLPIKSHTGRFLDSHGVREYQYIPRTLRAKGVWIAPERDRVYVHFGASRFATYRLSTFFTSDLARSMTQIARGGGPDVTREKYLRWLGHVDAEASASGWETSLIDGQDRFAWFDWDDRDYVYLGYGPYGWGIVKDVGSGLLPLESQVKGLAGVIVALKSESRYYAVLIDSGRSRIYDVTDASTPLFIRNVPHWGPKHAKASTANGDRIAIVGNNGILRIWRAADFIVGGDPAATILPRSGGSVFKDVTTDGERFYAMESYGTETSISVISPWGASYLERKHPVQTFSAVSLRYGSGYLAAMGSVAGQFDVHLYRLEEGEPREIDLHGFFANYYFHPPPGHTVPGNSLPRQVVVHKHAGKEYLIFSGNSLGDVYELKVPAIESAKTLPTLLVPGLCSEATTWNPMIHNLLALNRERYDTRQDVYSDRGVVRTLTGSANIPPAEIYTMTFVNPGASNIFDQRQVAEVPFESLADQLRDVVEKIRATTGSDQVNIVANSTGGLAARAYIQGLSPGAPLGDRRVKNLITIDTPHAGVTEWPSSCTAGGNSAQRLQMLPDSEFLDELNSKPIPPSVSLTAIASSIAGSESDGVISLSSQDLRNLASYQACNVGTENISVIAQEIPAAGEVHSRIHQLTETALAVHTRLQGATEPGRCIAIPLNETRRIQPNSTGRVHVSAQFDPGEETECAVSLASRNEAGSIIATATIDASDGQANLGVLPEFGWLEVSSTCSMNAAVSILMEESSACDPNKDLCLGQGRFRVSVAWEDFQGNSGVGHQVLLTDDSGYFWFFNPSNVELVIKVLDARVVNGKFWVFYGSLSNVKYTIAVTDTQTGETRIYQNPSGTFASVGDTEAFPGDETGSSTRTATAELGVETVAGGNCTPSATALCLNDGRFRVESSWKANGTTGIGTAVSLTPDTGYFWFFDPKNVELAVKALDGRVLNNRFWVFYGSLTNVEFTLRVTDTVNGSVREYTNPPNTFASRGDTEAFTP